MNTIRLKIKEIVRYKYIYLLILPGIMFFIIFHYFPMYGIQLAFKDFKIGKSIWESPWVGLEKFQMIFRNREFWRAFRNTLVLSFLKIVFAFPVPIILAMLINEINNSKLKRTLQTIYTFPHFLSWVVLAGILSNLLGNEGAVNNLITVFGGERVSFLSNGGIFRFVLIFGGIWKESGWSCIMYLAAIASIDSSIYESATIDGANRLQKAIYITWPGIKNMVAMLFILQIGNCMNGSFDQIFNLYNPTVFDVADTIDTYVYRITFQLPPDYGFSTAVGMFKGVINCILLLTANSVSRKLNDASLF